MSEQRKGGGALGVPTREGMPAGPGDSDKRGDRPVESRPVESRTRERTRSARDARAARPPRAPQQEDEPR
jgi:hypothetical protein